MVKKFTFFIASFLLIVSFIPISTIYNSGYWDVDIKDSVIENKKIQYMEAGYDFVGAVTKDDELYMWGQNESGQLATLKNEKGQILIPEKIENEFNNERIKSISLGTQHSTFLMESGNLYVSGNNYFGELGIGTTGGQVTIPFNITNQFNNEKIKEVSAYGFSTMALTETGKLYTWGQNNYGQLGDGTIVNKDTPIDITNSFSSDIIKSIADGNSFSETIGIITEDDDVYIWGRNNYKQVGHGSSENYIDEPYKINTTNFNNEKINNLVFSNNHTLVLTEKGNLFSWGLEDSGRLGNSIDSNNILETATNVTTNINNGNQIIDVVVTKNATMILNIANNVYTFGDADSGQIGNGTLDKSVFPYLVSDNFNNNIDPLNNVSLFAGKGFFGVSYNNKTGYEIWGNNQFGQLGIGNRINFSSPVFVEIRETVDLPTSDSPNLNNIIIIIVLFVLILIILFLMVYIFKSNRKTQLIISSFDKELFSANDDVNQDFELSL